MTLGASGSGATFDTAGFNVTLAGLLSGPGSLTKVDGGTLTLASSNSFSGKTRVNGGMLALGSPLALQYSTLDTSGSGLVNFGSLTTATLGGLTGSGTLILANASSAAVAISVGNNSASTTCSGALKGSGSLMKVGSGALALTGSSTFTGSTTVSQGKLVVDGWLTNSAVNVNGGTLGGSGNFKSITVGALGTLAPGDSQGVMQLSGNLTLLSGAAMDFALDGVSTDDEVSLPSGTLLLNNQHFSDFTFTPLAGFGIGTYNLIAFESVSGNLASSRGTIDGLPASLAVSNNDLVLTVVPEPPTAALLGAGILGLIGWAWRRRIWRTAILPSGRRPSNWPSEGGHPALPGRPWKIGVARGALPIRRRGPAAGGGRPAATNWGIDVRRIYPRAAPFAG